MREFFPKNYQQFFDPDRISMLDHALKRAWEIIRLLDPLQDDDDDEAKMLLAECLTGIAIEGEDDPLRLVNLAIVDFRTHIQKRNELAKRTV